MLGAANRRPGVLLEALVSSDFAMTARSRFLSPFTPDDVKGLKDLAKVLAVEAEKADYIVLVKRKAAVLFDCLLKCRLLGVGTPILFDHDDLTVTSGKRVLLFDDAVLSGETSSRARRRLREAGAASVRTIALAVASDAPPKKRPDLAVLQGPSDAIRSLINRELIAFRLLPRPYNLDWPLYEGSSQIRLLPYLVPFVDGEDLFDHSTASMRASGIASVSISIPRDQLIELEDALLLPANVVDLAKIRLYLVRGPSGEHWSALPIALLTPMPPEEVAALANAACAAKGVERRPQTTDAQLRFLSYVVAADLLDEWWARLSLDIELGPEDSFNTTAAMGNAVALAWLRRSRPRAPWPFAVAGASRNAQPLPAPATPVQVVRTGPPVSAEDLAEGVGHSRPKPVAFFRRSLKDAGLPNSDAWLSVFLDHSVDSGVLVPQISVANGLAFRGFRAGEVALLRENDLARFRALLTGYLDAYSQSSASRFVAHKLICIFLRYACHTGELSPVMGRHEGPTVAVNYYQHGVVATYRPANPFDFSIETDFLVYLTQKEVFGIEPADLPAGVQPDDLSGRVRPGRLQAAGEPKSDAEAIGALIGQLHGRGSLSNHKLMVLGSCPTTLDTLLALAGDLRLVANHLRRLPNYRQFSMTHKDVAQTVKSATEKFTAFQNGEATQILWDIEHGLGPLERRYWRDISEALQPPLERSDEESVRYIVKQAGDILAAMQAFDGLAARARAGTLSIHSIAAAAPHMRRRGLSDRDGSASPEESLNQWFAEVLHRIDRLVEFGEINAPLNSQPFVARRLHHFVVLVPTSTHAAGRELEATLLRLERREANANHFAVRLLERGSSLLVAATFGGERARQRALKAAARIFPDAGGAGLVVEVGEFILRPSLGTKGDLVVPNALLSLLPPFEEGPAYVGVAASVAEFDPRPFEAGEPRKFGQLNVVALTVPPGPQSSPKRSVRRSPSRCDILVVSILPEEAEAARSLGSDWERIPRDERNIERGMCGLDGRQLTIVHVRERQQGNVHMAAATEWAIRTTRPKIALLLGRAGGIEQEMVIGDIAIASSVLYYERRQLLETGTRYDFQTIDSHQLDQNVFERVEDRLHAGDGRLAVNDRRIFIGPIASGEAVMRTLDADVAKVLWQSHRKIIAVEMEAGGFATALQKHLVPGRSYGPDLSFIVRGISDLPAIPRDDGNNSRACAGAAAGAVELLRCACDELESRGRL